ncbi:MAG: hypothetical protein Q8M07_27485, partial [Prosthecobacter sp.]|nr:hypothetical protein [Prosthecobacter sp.]
RYLWARSLTQMRHTVLDNIEAMIVVGGACTGFKGRYAGVVEETLLALQRRKPVFLLGCMGGAAAAVCEALLGTVPALLTSSHQLSQKAEREVADYYNDTIVREDGADDQTPIDHDEVIKAFMAAGPAGLNNGLTADENLILLTSPLMQEVLPLLLKGLRNLIPTVPVPVQKT